MVRAMKPPIFVRTFSEEERERLEAGLRSKDAFALRRSQMLLASSRGDEVPQIAGNLGCGQQRRCATLSTISTRGVWMPCRLDPRDPKEPVTPSTTRVPKPCGRCSTALPGSSDTRRACGLCRDGG